MDEVQMVGLEEENILNFGRIIDDSTSQDRLRALKIKLLRIINDDRIGLSGEQRAALSQLIKKIEARISALRIVKIEDELHQKPDQFKKTNRSPGSRILRFLRVSR